jgi:hypothetical protein
VTAVLDDNFRSVRAVLLLCATVCAMHKLKANEARISHAHRTLDCGSITVASDTQLAITNDDLDAQGLSQVIRLTDMNSRRSVALPLFQDWSRNKDLHGQKALNGLVWAFDCVTARSGAPYVELFWSCTNPYAETCESAMSIRDEWMALYDKLGHSMPTDPRNMTQADERCIKRLGLWQSLMREDIEGSGGFTYFTKQVSPNGHIH